LHLVIARSKTEATQGIHCTWVAFFECGFTGTPAFKPGTIQIVASQNFCVIEELYLPLPLKIYTDRGSAKTVKMNFPKPQSQTDNKTAA
jgi:hypothetical protein